MRKLSFIILVAVCFTSATSSLAQSNPTVQIVLSQPTAKQGDTVTADVMVRNVVNLAGADIGITVDDKCLTIVDRQAGTLLPTTDKTGGFTAFSEQNDHDTRLAAAIIDRTKVATGEGIFYRTLLKVTCEAGIADLKVTFAELSSYKDPQATEVELNAFTLKAGTVTTVNTQLTIGAAGQTAQQTTAPAATPVVSAPSQSSDNSDMRQFLTTLLIPLICFVVVIFSLVAFLLVRRRRNHQG